MENYNTFVYNYGTFEEVKNIAKNEINVVILEIPRDKRKDFEVPEDVRCYICSKQRSKEWFVELAENLRPLNNVDKFWNKINIFKKLKLPKLNICVTAKFVK